MAVAPGRSGRPGAEQPGLGPPTEEELESCPFCEGRENRTPPEVLALAEEGRKPDTPGWSVRVVPNKYPAFERQEVVVHSPQHRRSIAELGAEQLELVAEAWRLRAAAAQSRGKTIFACVNEGRAAGASLLHSHSQLVWLDSEPPVAQAERSRGCPLCELLEIELTDGSRVVEQRDGLVLLCPYAGRAPYECLVAPLEHEANGYGPLLGTALDLAEHLDKIELYLGQVCQIAGISKMQLDYWTNKAQIPTKGKKQRIYDIDALETVMLIKQAKDKGLNLGAAIEAARRFRETNRAVEVS